MWLLQIRPPPQTPKTTYELQIQLIDVTSLKKTSENSCKRSTTVEKYVQKDI